MSERDWKRKEYNTWDEAFRALAPINRQQSVRVAEYTQILFTGACAESFGKDTAEGAARMRGQYADVAYKCGLYHQIGKALVPPEYQVWQKDFSEEETAVYRKYTTDGRLLVARLQERGVRAKEKRTGSLVEIPTKNIPWLMMRESCEQHMERFDGTGYPDGRRGNDISPIAQIVGLAKELDRLSAETKLERPFDMAYDVLTDQSGSAWDPALIQVLINNRDQCREVYDKYIHYTLTLPETVPLVAKSERRPMGLTFRPMIDGTGKTAAYVATPWFGGIANRPGETESIADVEEILKRTGTVADLSFYFMYEACDAIIRLENCGIENKGIILDTIPSFYKLPSQVQRIHKLFEDQPIPQGKLMLTIPEEMLIGATKTLEESVARVVRNGLPVVVDSFHPGSISADHLATFGIKHLRIAPDAYLKPETAEAMLALSKSGFTLIGANVSDKDTSAWLVACGATLQSGPIIGHDSSEDDIIRDGLAAQM